MTDVEAGSAAKPKRASKPRQKKAVSTIVVTTTASDAGTHTDPSSPASATSPTARPVQSQSARSRSTPAKNKSPRTARPARFRAAGPGLSDWLSFALLVLLIVGAVFLYQWRGEAAKLPAASQTAPAQTTGQPRP